MSTFSYKGSYCTGSDCGRYSSPSVSARVVGSRFEDVSVNSECICGDRSWSVNIDTSRMDSDRYLRDYSSPDGGQIDVCTYKCNCNNQCIDGYDRINLPSISCSCNRSYTDYTISITLPDSVNIGEEFTVSGSTTVGSVSYSEGNNVTKVSTNKFRATAAGTGGVYARNSYGSVLGTLTINKLSQSVTITGAVEAKVGIGVTLAAESSVGLTNFTYTCDSSDVIISGSTFKASKAGIYTVTAIEAGNDTYASASTTFTVTVTKQSQTITFSSKSGYATKNITLSASSSSGLTSFTYSCSSPTSLCSGVTISGSTFKSSKKGTFVVKVTQAGNDTYASASTTNNVYVYGLSQTLTYVSPTSCLVFESYRIVVNSTALTSYTYTLSDTSAGTISNGVVTFTKVGTFKITVKQAGNDVYNSASVTATVVVSKKTQILTYTGPTEFIVGVKQVVSASSSVGLSNFILSSEDPSVVINDLSVLFTKSGAFNLLLTEQGNDEYNSASVEITLFVGIDNLSPSLSLIS